MNKVTISKRLLGKSLAALVFTGCLASGSFAQTIMFNNGAQVYTAPLAIVQVNGGFQNDGAAGVTPVFENNGTMTIANSGTPGSVFLTNGSTLQGNGTYFVEQDWTNDATFTANNSTVNFNGDLQEFITSTIGTVTTFHNLTLSGAGATVPTRKKTLQLVNANVDATGVLNLNDRELETQTNTMFVLNPAVAAVVNTTTFLNEGYVSSAVGGALSRATNSTSAYVFPTGSSVGTQRYRAAQLTPATAAANVYTARLGNNIATADGFDVTQLDTNMCKVTALFYHQIMRTAGVDNAGIDIFYNAATDGPWDGLAQFNTPTAALWNSMGVVTATASATYNDNLKVNWADWTNSPFILSRHLLADPSFTCGTVCANSPANTFTATGPASATTYTWTTGSGTIASGQGTNTVGVDWGATPGPLTVTVTDAVGCFSNPYTCTVSVSTPPVAAFDTASSGFTFNFTDLTTGAPTSWAWDFGDGSSSSAQNPSHDFNTTGNQNVCLVTQNANGCADTACYTIDVNVNEYVNIPNVFTPNGDGVNDFFYINSSGLKDFGIDIYDRWGLKVFSSESAKVQWDGRSTAGVKLSDGTYFFILKAITITGKDKSTNGYITLLRNAN